RLPRVDRRDQEVVIVNACKSELPLLHRLLADLADGDAFDLSGAIKDQLWRGHCRTAVEEAGIGGGRREVAWTWAPRHCVSDRTVTITRVDGKRNDVGGRLESKFLSDAHA